MTRHTIAAFVEKNAFSLGAVAISLVAVLATSLGYGPLKTPAQTIELLAGRVANNEHRLDRVDSILIGSALQRDSMAKQLEKLQATACLQGDQRDLALIGIKCPDLINALRREAR